jgi:hypothetical protein
MLFFRVSDRLTHTRDGGKQNNINFIFLVTCDGKIYTQDRNFNCNRRVYPKVSELSP